MDSCNRGKKRWCLICHIFFWGGGKSILYKQLHMSIVRASVTYRRPWGKQHKLRGKKMSHLIYGDMSMSIIGILRWFFVKHLCSANQETSISVIYGLVSVCVWMDVCGHDVWVMPAVLTVDLSAQASSVCWSCRLLPAPRTAPPARSRWFKLEATLAR